MHGFTGNILHVDLTNRTTEIERPDEAFYRKYLGGSGLGMYYILRDTPAGADALSPENVLTFAAGPLTGTAISGQSRMSVNARSPLGGAIGDAQMGGFFPAEMKFAGFDAIIVKGAASSPVYLWLHDGQAEIRDASHIWGKISGEVDAALKAELGDDKIEIAQCGPGGEKLIRHASVMNMSNRSAGRTGMGAVMGSKKLKAIAVRGKAKPTIAHPDRFKALTQGAAKGVRANAAMFGLQTHGTAETVGGQQVAGGLPTHNWDSGVFDGWEPIDGPTMTETILLKNDTCYACAVRCKRVVQDEQRGLDPYYGGPEYETIATFGSYCNIDDLPAVALANQICNQYGLDTINTGATISFAMDCFEKGLITSADTNGVELRFGNTEAMLWALDVIIKREGIGDVLAEGTDYASQVWGAEELRTTVKGTNLPAHMPQVKRSLALIYAVNPFGADHQSHEHDPSYAPDNGEEDRRRMSLLGLNEQLDVLDLGAAKVNYALETQKHYSLLDSVSVCQFVYGPAWQLYGPDHLVEAVNAVTGWDMTIEETQVVGERRLNLMRAFNAREGIGREEDKLPKKMFKPLTGGASDGYRVTEEEMASALDTYYELAGWDVASGTPKPETLERLGLAGVAA
jgi:aldehyde:ferredoxin oxidoreductase